MGYNSVSEKKHRVPDNDKKYITTKSRGTVDVTYQDKGRYDPAEPRSSDYKHSERHSTSSKKPVKHTKW